MKITEKIIDEWAKTIQLIRRGDLGSDVEILQQLLTEFGINCAVDGDFGPKTEKAVEKFQESRIIVPDSVVGSSTKNEFVRSWSTYWKVGSRFKHKSGLMVWGSTHPDIGKIPGCFGKMSTFGGPNDWGDLMYGQSLVAAKTPQDVKRRYPELMDLGIFRGDVDELPKGVTNKKGRTYQPGISWMLDPDSYYIAMRFRSSQRRAMRKAPHNYPILVGSPKTGKWCLTVPTDYGPATWTERACDLSYGTQNVLGIETDDVVVCGWATPITMATKSSIGLV